MNAMLVGGPLDGLIYDVQDGKNRILVATPPMNAQQFIAAEEQPSLLEYAVMQPVEHEYVRDQTRLSREGYHRYLYGGTR